MTLERFYGLLERMRHTLRLLSVGIASVVLWHCVGDSTTTDGGSDATSDQSAMPDVLDASDAGADAKPPTAVQVGAGGAFACALLSDGSVWCWGDNAQGQLGLGVNLFDANPHPTPTQVKGLNGVTTLAVGLDSSCAIESDKSVWCWGENDTDQLGHDNAGDPSCGSNSKCNPVPQQITGLAASQIAAGNQGWCALNPAGAVSCWGNDATAILGNGAPGTSPPTPVPTAVVGLPANIKKISAGSWPGGVACAIDSTDKLWCWGQNSWGELGHVAGADGDWTDPSHCPNSNGQDGVCNATPHLVTLSSDGGGAPFDNVVDVKAGWTTCAVRNDGTTWCWGDNRTGGLGQGTVSVPGSQQPTPMAIALLGNDGIGVTGSDTLCAIKSTGKVWCWGVAHDEVPGDVGIDAGCTMFQTGSTTCDPTPHNVSNVLAASVSVGIQSNAVALTTDGHVVAWGSNGFGQLGHPLGTAGDQGANNVNPTPTLVQGLP